MADVHTQKQRSYNMSRIRSKNTAPEIMVRKYLHSLGFRYTLHNKKLVGKPDIVLPKFSVVIFVHGCFWHAHKNCRYFKLPGTRTEWWERKLEMNKINYLKACRSLKKKGWRVITIWECALKKNNSENSLARLAVKIRQ